MCHASAIGTSSNSLAGKFIREGSPDVKMVMENLLEGGRLHTKIDEQIVFSQLDQDENAIWSRLVASGYLKVENYMIEDGEENYELSLTNKEVQIMFRKMIKKWFSGSGTVYNSFIKAMLQNDVKSMNAYMNKVALSCGFKEASLFDRQFRGTYGCTPLQYRNKAKNGMCKRI